MNIFPKLLSGYLVISLLVLVTGYLGIKASGQIKEKFLGDEGIIRKNISDALEIQSYVKRAEGYLMLFLTLNDETDKNKFIERTASLQDHITQLRKRVSLSDDKKIAKITDKIQLEGKKVLPLGRLLIEKYTQEIAETGEFDPLKNEELIRNFHEAAAATRKSAVQFVHFETDFLNRQISITSATDVASYVKRAESYMLLYLTLNDEIDKNKFFERTASLQKNIALLEKRETNPENIELLNKIKVLSGKLVPYGEQLIEEHRQKITQSRKFNLSKNESLLRKFHATTAEIRKLAVELGAHHTELELVPLEKAKSEAKKIEERILFFMVGTFIFAVIFGWFLSKSISSPIQTLTQGTKKLGAGNLHIQMKPTSRDEIGVLTESFNKMARDLQETSVSKNYVDNILKTMTNCLMVLDPDGRITSVNQATVELLGYAEDGLLDKTLDSILSEKNILHLIQTGRIRNTESVLLKRDSKSVPVLLSASEMQDSAGETTAFVVVAQDIALQKANETARKQLNRELKERNAEMEQFTYRVSHDLRAPLVNIKGFAEELRTSLDLAHSAVSDVLPHLQPEVKDKVATLLAKDIPESLDFIGSSVTRMDTLITALLKLSRVEGRALSFQTLDMNELVQTTIKTLAHQIETRKAQLTVQPLPQVVADPTSIEQIVTNLLDNAVKYLDSKGPGKIEVSGEQKEQLTLFQIRDNGRGISEEDQQRIFEIFYRAGKHDTPGEGMGLAHVKALVRRHKGDIWCDSKLDEGTTFYFSIANHLPKREDAL